MSTGNTPPRPDAQQEISSLIEVLDGAERRLTELTAGEVDSVSSAAGRTFLLRGAQEFTREHDAAQQLVTLDALNASELRFRQMAENIRDVFFLTDATSNRIHYVSPAFEEIWGSSCASLYENSQGWTDAIHPDDRAAIAEERKNRLLHRKYALEYRIVRPDGSTRRVAVRGYPVPDAAGNTIRIAGVAEDITDRSRMEESLRDGERHFHFLDDLAEAARGLIEPERIVAVMTRMLGKHLHVSRCAFAEVDAEQFAISHDYTDGCASAAGSYQLSQFGTPVAATLRRSQTFIVRDAKAEHAFSEGADMFGRLDIQAIICCPLVKDGRLVAMMAVHQTMPRAWTVSEVAVVEEVLERCWAAIERRSAEQKMRANEALLRIAGRTARLGGWAVEAAGSRVTWSDEVCSVLEVARGTVPSFDLAMSFCVPESRGIVGKALDECLQKGIAFDVELEVISARGRKLWARCTGEPQRDSAGAIARVRGAFQDITADKRAAATLQASVAEFRLLAEAMPQIVWIARADGWTEYFNRHWMDYTGLTLSESLGHGWNQPFHPADRDRTWDTWQKATATGTTFSTQSRVRRADGQYRWWLVRAVPTRDSAGVILKWFGTCTDIHDLKMAELAVGDSNQALRESERRFTDMLGNVQLASIMLDGEARITYCNDYFLRLTGWQREEVIGRDWFEAFVPLASDDVKAVFAALLVDPPPAWHRESEIVTRSGERRLIRWNISTLRSAEGAVIGTASIGEDITERRRAGMRIRHLNRVYTVLSGINSLIVRVRERDELFREACRLAVEGGGFRMAMIGIVDRLSGQVVPVASAGMDEELVSAVRREHASTADAAATIVARAISGKQAVVSNDSQTDAGVLLQEKYLEAGVRSMAVFPLLVADAAMGVLALYASETEFFHEEELKLLTQLTNDIAFAIDHIEKSDRLNYLAYYDSLTGLSNRILIYEQLTQAIKRGHEQQRKLALVLVDVERFKTITDTFGREAGDGLLKELARRLQVDESNVCGLARIDADHFAIMICDLQTERELVRRVEQRIADVFGPPFRIGNSELRMSAKFGIAMFPSDGADADALFRNAEAALKNAKASGERCLFYKPSMNERVAERLLLENQLRHALENDEFVLHYQPTVSLVNRKLTSCEALIRWNDPRTGLVAPGKFIPIMEETGLIFEMGRWALRQAIATYLGWRDAGLPAVRIAVNVSPLQLRNRGFVTEVEQLLSVDAHAAAGLELEITEGMIMEDVKNSTASLEEIRAMGVTIAIDDFGTGFSSLSYLSRLPVDTLKIDRSFVNEMGVGTVGLALVSTIITLAHSVKLRVIAEGVETEEQAGLLGSLACDEMQGFLFSQALPRAAFEARFLAAPA